MLEFIVEKIENVYQYIYQPREREKKVTKNCNSKVTIQSKQHLTVNTRTNTLLLYHNSFQFQSISLLLFRSSSNKSTHQRAGFLPNPTPTSLKVNRISKSEKINKH